MKKHVRIIVFLLASLSIGFVCWLENDWTMGRRNVYYYPDDARQVKPGQQSSWRVQLVVSSMCGCVGGVLTLALLDFTRRHKLQD
jgi:hypothetical protein